RVAAAQADWAHAAGADHRGRRARAAARCERAPVPAARLEARMKRIAAAVVAFLLAGALAMLAHDVHRWQRAVDRGDVRFLVQPTESRLWAGPGGTSGDLARHLLGLGDDLEFRQAERLFVRGHIPVSTYELELRRLTARGSAVALLD